MGGGKVGGLASRGAIMGARRASLASRMAMGRRGDRGTDAGPPLRPASYVCYYCRVCLDGQGNSDHCDDCPRVSCEPFKIVITFLEKKKKKKKKKSTCVDTTA